MNKMSFIKRGINVVVEYEHEKRSTVVSFNAIDVYSLKKYLESNWDAYELKFDVNKLEDKEYRSKMYKELGRSQYYSEFSKAKLYCGIGLYGFEEYVVHEIKNELINGNWISKKIDIVDLDIYK